MSWRKFWSRVLIDPAGCWVWQGHRKKNGHGAFAPSKRTNLYAHRLSYEACIGPIPPGLVVCHRCKDPACVNPDHLFLATSPQRKVKLRERFMQMVAIGSATECWEWQGSRKKPPRHPYGYFRREGKIQTAHRVSYELHVGPIATGMCVLHQCDNPPCVNPAHLFLGTQIENMADKKAKGRNATGDRNGMRRRAIARRVQAGQ